MSKPKKLSILGTYVPSMEVRKDDEELLFFSINSFSEISYNSLDIEDFFSRGDFEDSIDLFNESLIKLLKKIDENLKTCNIEGSFFDSGFWLTHRFSDIYFLHSLTEQINSLYEDVNLYVPKNYTKLNIEKCNLKDFSFKNLDSGLIHSLQFLECGLINPKVIRVDEKNNFFSFNFLRLSQLFLRSFEILKRRVFLKFFVFLKSIFSRKKYKKVLIFKNGYDLDFLINKYSSKIVKYLDLNKININNFGSSDLDEDTTRKIIDEIDSFLNHWLPLYKNELKIFFSTFLEEISLKANSLRNSLEKEILSHSPDAILFNSGATSLFEKIISRISNEYNVSIYYLRHQGIELSFLRPSYLDLFIDKQPDIKRIQFLNHKLEHKLFNLNKKVELKYFGLIDFSQPLIRDSQNKKGILYSVGPPAHFSFKNLRNVISDRERYNLAKNLFEESTNSEINLDIKVHPGELKLSYDLFRRLVRRYNEKKNLRIIVDGSIERILKNYDLVILDIISSRVLTYSLFLKKNIILYVPENYSVNEYFYEHLLSRVHIVKNKSDLESVLINYKKNTLPKKDFEGFDKIFFSKNYHDNILESFYNEIFKL